MRDIDLDEMRSTYEGDDATPIGETAGLDAADLIELLAERLVREN